MFIDADTSSITVNATGFERVDRAVVEELGGYPAANVGDVLGRFGLMDAGISPVWPGARCAGTALTVWTREGDNLAIHRAFDEVRPGDVMVINGFGDTTRALVGDLLGEMAIARGAAGLVIDGVVRDADGLRELGLPVWSRGACPAGPTKNGPGYIGRPVACGGVVVRSGDVIVADGDGVAVIPHEETGSVLEGLRKVASYEAAQRQRIRDLGKR